MKKIAYGLISLILVTTLTACSSSSLKKNISAVKEAASEKNKDETNETESENTSSLKGDLEDIIDHIQLERDTAEIMVFKDVELSTEEIEGEYDVFLIAGTMNLRSKKTGEKYRDFKRLLAVFNKNDELISIKDEDQVVSKKIYNTYEMAYHERNGKVKINKL